MKKIIIGISLLLLVGCGSSDSEGDKTTDPTTTSGGQAATWTPTQLGQVGALCGNYYMTSRNQDSGTAAKACGCYVQELSARISYDDLINNDEKFTQVSQDMQQANVEETCLSSAQGSGTQSGIINFERLF